MNVNGIDITNIALIVLAALAIAGGGYAIFAKNKLRQLSALFVSLSGLIDEFLIATEDGTISKEERETLIRLVWVVVEAFLHLVSKNEQVILQSRMKRLELSLSR